MKQLEKGYYIILNTLTLKDAVNRWVGGYEWVRKELDALKEGYINLFAMVDEDSTQIKEYLEGMYHVLNINFVEFENLCDDAHVLGTLLSVLNKTLLGALEMVLCTK